MPAPYDERDCNCTSLETRVLAVADVLVNYLPAEIAEERARNIVQALADEQRISSSDVRLSQRRTIVRDALVLWKLAPKGWNPTPTVERQVLKVLEST